MGFFDQASKKFAEVQKKTGDTIAVYKLQSQIKNIEEEIQQIYATIGEVCYAAHKSGKSPEGLDSLFENIDSMKASIAELNDDIDRLNQIVRSPTCGNSRGEGDRFCEKCGHMYGAEVPAEQPEAAEEVPAEEPAEEAPAEGEEA